MYLTWPALYTAIRTHEAKLRHLLKTHIASTHNHIIIAMSVSTSARTQLAQQRAYFHEIWYRRISGKLVHLHSAISSTTLHTCRHAHSATWCTYTKHKLGKYTQSNKNPSAWYFVRPAQAVTCGTVAIIIRVVFLSPYLCIRGVSLSSIHYNQSHRVYINRRQQYICLIWKLKH